MERDYRYVVLNGNHSLHGCKAGGRKHLRCFLATLLCVGVSIGLYFVFYTRTLSQQAKSSTNTKLLLISIDAFRYDLRDKAPTKNLDWIARHGVSAGYMENVFPTVTITNHQSIVTGLYPEHHGLVGNKMFDRKTKEHFTMSNTQAKFWNDAVPIWTENELQGHKSGVCYFPGYDVKFGGKQATYVPPVGKYLSPLKSEEKVMPYQQRVELVVDWLSKPDVNLVVLYFGGLDVLMHAIGPDPVKEKLQKKLADEITAMDNFIGVVKDKLLQANLTELVNVIIVGDHGQSNTNSTTRVIDLTRYVDLPKLAYAFGDGHIYAKPGQTQIIYDKLKEAEQKEGHIKIYLKKDIPDRYHIRDHPRTGDILYVMDEGWSVWLYGTLNRASIKAGYHGYDNQVANMHPAFLAYGPAFREGYKQDVVRMVDLYELMCHILGIKPRANDGHIGNVQSMLRS